MRYTHTLTALLFSALAGLPVCQAAQYVPWQAQELAINAPLGGLKGDPARGREIVKRQERGNCLACHQLPIPEEAFHGTVGPPLTKLATRLTEGQIRLRVADESVVVPDTIMPAFHKNPAQLNLVASDYYGKPVLSAQEMEDVVAYLMTLK